MGGIQILVVEDNGMQSKLVSSLLQEDGHSVQTAASAEEALEVLRSFSPDLILMDLQLPGMDSLELTQAPKHEPVQATTPIDTATFARLAGQYLNPTVDIPADLPSDSSDVLSEIRNTFLAEGLEQCGTILKGLKSDPSYSIEGMQRVLHRWASMAVTLGFLEISHQARKTEALLTETSPLYDEVEKAIKTVRRRFCIAARNPPRLPVDLIAGLKGVRIGLLNFSEEDANRIRSAAHDAHVEVSIDRIEDESIENQMECGVLVINECAISAEAALHGPHLFVPAIFIRSRSSLQFLSKLPAPVCDFLIAPWDAEEVLIRAYRLIAGEAPPQPDLTDAQKSRPRVLIADDDPIIIAILSKTLQKFEMDCDVARSGEQALEAVWRCPPDAIVLDVNMLDLDGFEVLKRLRGNLFTKEIPVLLLTARNQESDISRGFGSGADDYVVKPFMPLDLVKRVDKMICARRKLRTLYSAALCDEKGSNCR